MTTTPDPAHQQSGEPPAPKAPLSRTDLEDAVARGDEDFIKKFLAANGRRKISSQVLCRAAAVGNAAAIEKILPLTRPALGQGRAMRLAAKHGHAEAFRLLLPFYSPTHGRLNALQLAVNGGHTEIVRQIVEYIKVKGASIRHDPYPIANAAGSGNLEMLGLLLTVSDPAGSLSLALRFAAQRGKVEAVKMLIPFSDPSAKDGEALRVAAASENTDMVDLLIPVSGDVAKIIKSCATARQASFIQVRFDAYVLSRAAQNNPQLTSSAPKTKM